MPDERVSLGIVFVGEKHAQEKFFKKSHLGMFLVTVTNAIVPNALTALTHIDQFHVSLEGVNEMSNLLKASL